MKKLILFAAIAILMTTAINAQIRIGETNTLSYYYLPAELTSNDADLLQEIVGDSIIRLYDNNLNITDIQLPERVMRIWYSNIGDYGKYLVISQTMFNNDSDFEYLRYTTTNERYNEYGHVTIADITKIEAVNMSGNVLFSIDATNDSVFGTVRSYGEDEVIEASSGVNVFKWGSSFYLVVPMSFPVEGGEYVSNKYVWYRINQQTQSVTRINGNLPMNVFPTIADCSQTITVELGDGNNASEVQVVNAVGQVVKQISLQPGQRKVQFRASDLGSGMHIVGTRSREGQGACKIIVK